MKSVAIIVLNWNQQKLTLDTISSLFKIKHPSFDYHIVLVDNGSTDNSLDTFNQEYQNNSLVTILESGSNLGFVDGNNYGIHYALDKKFDYILVLNNDVIVDSDFLQNIYQFHIDNPQYCLISPKIYFAPGHEFHHDRYKKTELGKVIWFAGGHFDWNNVYGTNIGIDEVDHGQYDQVNDQIDFLSGCCLFIDSRIFSKISIFDSRYFMYLEDADICQRAKRAGFKIAYFPGAFIWHINAGSSAAGGGPLHDYFLTRNRLLFGNQFCSSRTRVALFRQAIKTYLSPPSKWQKIGVRDYFIKRFGKGSWQK